MKKLVFILGVLLIFLSSCEEKREEVKEWTGLSSISSRLMPPVCAVWYKPSPLGWLPNKCFARGDEIRKIIRLLQDEKEAEIPNPAFKGTQKLSLIFYKGSPETLAVREISFDLNDGTFIWAFGKSDKLGKLLTEKEMWGSYHPDVNDPNLIKRAKESQEYLRKEIKKRMAEKEAEDRKRIKEANQSE
jgi:hypothetical protein